VLFLDVDNRLVRHEVVQRKVALHPVAQFRGTDREQMAVATMQPQTGDGRRGLHRISRSFQKNELHQPGELRDVLPKVKLGQLVTANDPIKIILRIKRPEMPAESMV